MRHWGRRTVWFTPVIAVLIVIGIWLVLATCGDGYSSPARRYAYVPHRRALLMERLVSMDEVRSDLSIGSHQAAQLDSIGTKREPVAEIRELKRSFRSALVVVSSARRKRALIVCFDRLRDILYEEEIMNDIAAILDPLQLGRFEQIVLQVYGPRELLELPSLSGRIGLTRDQRTEMKRIVASNFRESDPLRRAIGRYVIAGFPFPDTDKHEADEVARKLVGRLRKLERRMDEDILDILAPKQRDMLPSLEGRVLQISWSEESCFRL